MALTKPRGETTRGRILRTALELFAIGGVDGVSTRQIAAAASVPPASLRYYFKDKQGLYEACFAHISHLTLQVTEPSLRAAEALLDNPIATPAQLIEAYCDVQESCAELLIGADDGTIAMFVIRSDLPTENGLVAAPWENVLGARFLACHIGLLKRLGNGALTEEAAVLLATMIHGQLMTLCLARPRLDAGGWPLTPDRVKMAKRTLRDLTAAGLRSRFCDGPSRAGASRANIGIVRPNFDAR